MIHKVLPWDAEKRSKIDKYYRIVGDFLVRYGDPSDTQFMATIRLIEGCRYSIEQVAVVLSGKFPRASDVSVCDKPHLDEMYIDLEWSDLEHEWSDHSFQFEKRVVSTLKTLSLK